MMLQHTLLEADVLGPSIPERLCIAGQGQLDQQLSGAPGHAGIDHSERSPPWSSRRHLIKCLMAENIEENIDYSRGSLQAGA